MVYDEVTALRTKKRSRYVSPAALELHVRAVSRSVLTDCPVFVPDAMLDEIAPAQVTTLGALELCLAGLWDRARDGYVVSDLELIERLGSSPLRRTMTSMLRHWRAVLHGDNSIPR